MVWRQRWRAERRTRPEGQTRTHVLAAHVLSSVEAATDIGRSSDCQTTEAPPLLFNHSITGTSCTTVAASKLEKTLSSTSKSEYGQETLLGTERPKQEQEETMSDVLPPNSLFAEKHLSCKASILTLLLLFTPPPCLSSACVRKKGPCQQREPLSYGGDRRQSGRRREGKKGKRETVKRDGGERRRRCCCPRGDVILIPSSSLLPPPPADIVFVCVSSKVAAARPPSTHAREVEGGGRRRRRKEDPLLITRKCTLHPPNLSALSRWRAQSTM